MKFKDFIMYLIISMLIYFIAIAPIGLISLIFFNKHFVQVILLTTTSITLFINTFICILKSKFDFKSILNMIVSSLIGLTISNLIMYYTLPLYM